MLITGQCQCGNISFNLEWLPDPTRIPAWACACSFCQAHKGVWTSSPSADLKVRISNLALLTRHTFGTRTAEFLICKQCEDIPLVTSEIDGRLYAVANIHALQGISPTLLKHFQSDFDGESVEERTERRRRNWIANVTINGSLDE
jgi:hypothetical protein